MKKSKILFLLLMFFALKDSCNVNGVVVKQAIGVADSCTVSLNDIASGFYLVKFNSTTFKFFKK